MIHEDKELGIKWLDSLDDAKTIGYFPIKCTNPLEFFTLRGKTSILTKDNVEPLRYLYYAVYSPQEKRYYQRFHHVYSLNQLFFYKQDSTFSGQDESIESLHKYIYDGNLWLLYSKLQVDTTRDVMARIWKANLSTEGDIDFRRFYPISLEIMDASLKLEEYKDYAKALTGYRTCINQQEQGLLALWKKASESCVKVKALPD